MASGWMRVKQRAKQRGVELPLVISDHADWDELLATMRGDGRAGGVDHARAGGGAGARGGAAGIRARALALVGYEEEETDDVHRAPSYSVRQSDRLVAGRDMIGDQQLRHEINHDRDQRLEGCRLRAQARHLIAGRDRDPDRLVPSASTR